MAAPKSRKTARPEAAAAGPQVEDEQISDTDTDDEMQGRSKSVVGLLMAATICDDIMLSFTLHANPEAV